MIVLPDYGIKFGASESLRLVVPFQKKDYRKWLEFAVIGRPTTLAFKHYHSGGSKSWTYTEGYELSFDVPKIALRVQKEHGYSYPRLNLDGEEIKLNVSGGTGGPGWVDWCGEDRAGTCVDLTGKALMAIAHHALTCGPCQILPSKEEEERIWKTENADKLQVLAAWGDWAAWVPDGLVGVVACVGGRDVETLKQAGPEVWAIVPEAEYDSRTRYPFIVDPSRHTILDAKPENQHAKKQVPA